MRRMCLEKRGRRGRGGEKGGSQDQDTRIETGRLRGDRVGVRGTGNGVRNTGRGVIILDPAAGKGGSDTQAERGMN